MTFQKTVALMQISRESVAMISISYIFFTLFACIKTLFIMDINRLIKHKELP